VMHSWQHVIQRRQVIIDIGEGFRQGIQRGQQRQQPAMTDRLHDQPVTLLLDECFITFQLKLAGDAWCLVAPVAKEAHMAFRS